MEWRCDKDTGVVLEHRSIQGVTIELWTNGKPYADSVEIKEQSHRSFASYLRSVLASSFADSVAVLTFECNFFAIS